MYLLAICMSSWGKCPFRSLIFISLLLMGGNFFFIESLLILKFGRFGFLNFISIFCVIRIFSTFIIKVTGAG